MKQPDKRTEFLRGWLPRENTWSSFFLRTDHIVINQWVAAFALALALVSGVLFSLLPAFRGTSLKLAEWVKEGASSSLGSPRCARGSAMA